LEGDHAIDAERSSVSLHGITVVLGERFDVPAGPAGIAVRGEDIQLGDDAEARDLVLAAHLRGRVYRGLYTDYRLQLEDGQMLSAMTGRHLDVNDGDRLTIGVDASALVPLLDD